MHRLIYSTHLDSGIHAYRLFTYLLYVRSVAGAVEELQMADSDVALGWNCKVIASMHAAPSSGLQPSTQLTAYQSQSLHIYRSLHNWTSSYLHVAANTNLNTDIWSKSHQHQILAIF